MTSREVQPYVNDSNNIINNIFLCRGLASCALYSELFHAMKKRKNTCKLIEFNNPSMISYHLSLLRDPLEIKANIIIIQPEICQKHIFKWLCVRFAQWIIFFLFLIFYVLEDLSCLFCSVSSFFTQFFFQLSLKMARKRRDKKIEDFYCRKLLDWGRMFGWDTKKIWHWMTWQVFFYTKSLFSLFRFLMTFSAKLRHFNHKFISILSSFLLIARLLETYRQGEQGML